MSKKKKIQTRTYLANFHVAGFTYYEGPMAFEHLKIGRKLSLEREPENRYDRHAVALYYEEMKIGFIPKNENRIVAKLLDAGIDHFEAVVNRVSQDEHPEQQVGVVLYVINQD